VYFNVGETYTKGVSYAVLSEEDSALKNKTFLIYDIPAYFKVDTTQLGDKIELLRSKQYPGFLIETQKYKSLNDYMLANFSKNSRNKNNKYKRRLEDSFNMSYRMFYGAITKEAYDLVFLQFRILLEKRFEDKQVTNNNLDEKEWSFYHDVAYQLILEKKASLYVIYNNDKPIGVTLCYLSDDKLFDAITVFDIDYFKFHLGTVTIMELIEWCIDNGFKNLDFFKGYFEYKTR
jgi:CelD/BcsL family acetyltransferase involved in cellulose biosynthesis